MRVPAALSRTGVQLYPQHDGTVRREYRPPAEVFAAKSLATFDTATVVVGHPDTISSANWREHAVGDIRAAKQDGKYVSADLVIRDAATIAQIDSGALKELSCGYDCVLDMSPGVSPEGETYDAIQRDIVINHVGMGPGNWGRAGSEVRLRLDGGGVSYADERDGGRRPPSMTPEEIKALQDKLAAEKARADAAEAKVASRTDADVAAERARADATQAKLDEALSNAKKLTEQADPARVDARVAARVTVLDGARILHSKPVAATGTDREIMVAAIKSRDPNFDAADRSDDYIRARFDAKVEDARRAGDDLANVNRGTSPGHLDAHGGGHTYDGVDADTAAAMAHFDHAMDFPKRYSLAQPWLNGESAAFEAAHRKAG